MPAPGARTHDVEMGILRFYPLSMFHGPDTLDWELDWSRRPLADAVEEFFAEVGSRSPSYDLWFPHPVELRRFPAGHPFDAAPVPVLMTIGWWDNCAPWQWSDHAELQSRPGWALNEYLLLEAIDHENNSHFELDDHRPATESDAVLRRYLDPAVEFFDVFLRGDDREIPRIRWQLAGSGDASMRTATTWPPETAASLVLHLAGGTAAAASPAGGALDPAPQASRVGVVGARRLRSRSVARRQRLRVPARATRRARSCRSGRCPGLLRR